MIGGSIITMVLAGILGLGQAENNSTQNNHIQSVTSVCKVLGDGRKVAAVVIEYDTPIKNASLGPESFLVEGKEVVRVYANAAPELSSNGSDGRYVIIEVKAEVNLHAQPKQPSKAELEAKKERDRMQGGPGLRAGWSTGGNDEYPGNATVTQTASIRTAAGKTVKASGPVESGKTITLVADDFTQHQFISPYTGQALPYNLYVPEDYDPSVKYPLLLFIHDAGVASGPVTHTLYQGNGATSWAEPEFQARHKCIVVAPEYPVITVDDNWNYSHHLDATIALLKDLQKRYSIDSERIYTTGQSMGCMSSIVMMLKEPGLFAGALLVAGKWNPELMGPLDRQNIWIISCEGDQSSNTLQSQAVELWRNQGSKVTEATWDMTLSPDELSAEADKMRTEGNHLLFTHLTGGNHRATWFVAYGIKSVQDWLFSQRKRDPLAEPSGKTDWVDSVKDTPENVEYVLYPTAQRGEGTQGSCMVFLPEEYKSQPDRRFPVIYYLHGGNSNQREGRWLISEVDSAIRSGKMSPAIVVCPQALPIGWYINANVNDPKVISGPVEDVLIYDLIPFIDANYRTVADRCGRGVEGFSMGGRGAMMLAFKHPDLFCAVSSVAGALVDWDEEPLQRALECTFGDVDNPRSREYFEAWHPKVFACQNARRIINDRMSVRMFVGDRDRLYEENGRHITQRFHELLDGLHILHSYTIVPGAGHNPAEIFAKGVNDYDTSFWNAAFAGAR